MNKIEIPFRLPSLNEYIKASKVIKGKWNAGNQMKQDKQKDIMMYLNKLPKYEKPIKIHFHWIEENKRRDLDNVCFAKKFILDSMVKAGKLKDDNSNLLLRTDRSGSYFKTTETVGTIKENDCIQKEKINHEQYGVCQAWYWIGG